MEVVVLFSVLQPRELNIFYISSLLHIYLKNCPRTDCPLLLFFVGWIFFVCNFASEQKKHVVPNSASRHAPRNRSQLPLRGWRPLPAI